MRIFVLFIAALFLTGASQNSLRAADNSNHLMAESRAAVDSLAAEVLEAFLLPLSAQGWRAVFESSANIDSTLCGCDDRSAAKLREAWVAAVKSGYNPEEIVAHVKMNLIAGVSQEELRQIIEHRNRPIGRIAYQAERLTILEAMSATPEAQAQEIFVIARKLETDKDRRATIHDISKVIDMKRLQADSLMAIAEGTILGALAATPKGQPRHSEQEMLEMLEGQRAMVEAGAEEMAILGLASLYDQLSNEELRQYLASVSVPLMRKASVGIGEAFNAALRVQARKIGRGLAKEMSANKI